MLSTLVKYKKFCKLFFAMSFTLSTVFIVNPENVLIWVHGRVTNAVENTSLLLLEKVGLRNLNTDFPHFMF